MILRVISHFGRTIQTAVRCVFVSRVLDTRAVTFGLRSSGLTLRGPIALGQRQALLIKLARLAYQSYGQKAMASTKQSVFHPTLFCHFQFRPGCPVVPIARLRILARIPERHLSVATAGICAAATSGPPFSCAGVHQSRRERPPCTPFRGLQKRVCLAESRPRAERALAVFTAASRSSCGQNPKASRPRPAHGPAQIMILRG